MSDPIRVLIIEDDEQIATLLMRFLQQSALLVDHEADGQRGVDRFLDADVPYDVLLVDGLLPTRTGFSIAEEVRLSPRGATVGMIMMSAAFKSGNSRREATAAGFDGFFAKPFVAADLVAAVMEVAERRAGKRPPGPSEIAAARARIQRQSRERATKRRAKTPSAHRSSSPSGAPARPTDAEAAAPTPQPPTPARSSAASPPAAARVVLAKAKPPAPPPDQQPLTAPEHAPWFLVATARARRTGIVRFAHGSTQLELAFLDGIVVGAWDNLRENRLGERLLREGDLTEEDIAEIDQRMRASGERFMEAAIALDLLDEDRALNAIDAQGRDRLIKATAFDEGSVTFEPDETAVERMSGTPIDLVEAVLSSFLARASRRLGDRLRDQLSGAALTPTRDFEPGLVAFARLRPASALPGQFFAGPRPVAEVVVLGEAVLEELVAMRMAGMLRGPDDPEHTRMIPHHLQLADDGGDLDEALVKRVRRAVLRARGRDLYGFLGLDRDAERGAIGAALGALDAELGREAVDLGKLGPARDGARELWTRLDEARRTLLNDDRRKAYDATLPPKLVVDDLNDGTEATVEVDAGFLEGRVLLAQRDVVGARMAFERAVAARPDDAEFAAFLGWASVLDPGVERGKGVDLLNKARSAHPHAMRPLLFLGLAAAQEGRREDAAALLQQASRMDPDNRDVQAALAALSAEQPAPPPSEG